MMTASRLVPSRTPRALNRSASSRGMSNVSVSFTLPGTAEDLVRRAMATLAICSGVWPARRFGGDGTGRGSCPGTRVRLRLTG